MTRRRSGLVVLAWRVGSAKARVTCKSKCLPAMVDCGAFLGPFVRTAGSELYSMYTVTVLKSRRPFVRWISRRADTDAIELPTELTPPLLPRPTVDGKVTTPCQRCAASNLECVIGGSNRGGRRVRRKTLPNQDTANLDRGSEHGLGETLSTIPEADDPTTLGANTFGVRNDMTTANATAMALDPALQAAPIETLQGEGDLPRATRESSTTTNGNIAFNDLQNPSDALGIL